MTINVEAARQGYSAPGYPMARVLLASMSMTVLALAVVAFVA